MPTSCFSNFALLSNDVKVRALKGASFKMCELFEMAKTTDSDFPCKIFVIFFPSYTKDPREQTWTRNRRT
jgi:hypothetical protein